MKITLFLLFLVPAFFANSQLETDTLSGAKIEFISTLFDLDSIIKGDNAEGNFLFINTGDSPLIITTVKYGSKIGLKYPKNSIMPNDTGKISFHYDNKRVGRINKPITVFSNAVNSPLSVLRMKGQIYYPETELLQTNFSFNLGILSFNESKTIEFDVKCKIGQLFMDYKYNPVQISTYDDIMKVYCNQTSKLESHVTLIVTNKYGNIGLQTFRYKLGYNDAYITVDITVNFIGNMGDTTIKIEAYPDTRNRRYYNYNYKDSQIDNIVYRTKYMFDKNSEWTNNKIVRFKNGHIFSVERNIFIYKPTIETTYYETIDGELIVISKEKKEY